jgi:hypothetical protein
VRTFLRSEAGGILQSCASFVAEPRDFRALSVSAHSDQRVRRSIVSEPRNMNSSGVSEIDGIVRPVFRNRASDGFAVMMRAVRKRFPQQFTQLHSGFVNL